MKLKKSHRKILSTGLLILLLCGTLLAFNSLNIEPDLVASAYTENPKKDVLNIPSDINFIEDDKKAFIEYCKSQFGTDAAMSIDKQSYLYYGISEGYRLYRLSVTCMPADSIGGEQEIGGYTFYTSCRYRPYDLGLYVIGENGAVYTLDQAYRLGLVDISSVYRLYQQKS